MNAFKEKIKRFSAIDRHKKINFLIFLLLAVSVVVFLAQWLTSFLTSGYIFEIGFFQRTRDIVFSDFFHVNDMVFYNSPYFGDTSSYPPLVLLFAKIFSHMADYSDGYENMLEQPAAVVSVCLFYGIVITASAALLIYVLKKKKLNKIASIIVVIAFFLCAPMIFEIERGNYIIYAMLFSLAFFVFFDHEKAVVRELSYISLAIAVGIKLYPALFAVVLLKNKKIAEFLRCAAYSVILLILPFFFFDKGLSNLPRFLYYLLNFSNELTDYGYNYSIASTLEICFIPFGHTLYKTNTLIKALQSFIPYLFLVICLISALLADKNWKILASAAVAIIQFPNISFAYTGMFLWIPLLAFIFDKEKKRIDYLYALWMTIPLLPVFLGFIYPANAISFNQILSALCLILLEGALAVEAAMRLTKWIKKTVAVLKKKWDSKAIE